LATLDAGFRLDPAATQARSGPNWLPGLISASVFASQPSEVADFTLDWYALALLRSVSSLNFRMVGHPEVNPRGTPTAPALQEWGLKVEDKTPQGNNDRGSYRSGTAGSVCWGPAKAASGQLRQ
jgi:hypothetical protein